LDSSPLFRSTNQHHQIQLDTCYLPYIKFPKMPNNCIFALKMATLMFAETLDNFQHSTRLIPEAEVVQSNCYGVAAPLD
jgi:hypothetical protein